MNAPLQAVATLQTPGGRGGIAVVCLAGRDADRVLAEVFRPLTASANDEGGQLRLGMLHDGEQAIDEALVCRRGQTYEINLHGGPAAVRALLRRLADCGAALADAAGGAECFPLAHPRWNNPAVGRELLEALGQARGRLVAAALAAQWSAGLSELARRALAGDGRPAELRGAAAGLAAMRRLLAPAEVVLAGPPNAGKSTLANLLVGRAVSIVHDQPGTTRDWVREPATIDGVPVWLTDTAGLWEAGDAVDAEAVRRARQCIASSDLVLLLEAGAAPALPPWLAGQRVLTVATKADLAAPACGADATVSARSEQGLGELRGAIVRRLGLAGFDPAAPCAFTDRQATLLLHAADALDAGQAGPAHTVLRELLGA